MRGVDWIRAIRLGQLGAYIPAGTRVFRGVRPDVDPRVSFVDHRRPFDLYSNSRYSYFGTWDLAYEYCVAFTREDDSFGRRGKILEYSVAEDTPVVDLAITRWDFTRSREVFPAFERLMQLNPPMCQHDINCVQCCFGYHSYRPDVPSGYPSERRISERSCDSIFTQWYFTISTRGFYFIHGENDSELVLPTRAVRPTDCQWSFREDKFCEDKFCEDTIRARSVC